MKDIQKTLDHKLGCFMEINVNVRYLFACDIFSRAK